MKTTVVGGAGVMGNWFSSFFSKYSEVTICDIDEKAPEVAKSIGVRYESDMESAVKDSDIVLIAVPMDAEEGVIRENAPKMQVGSLLMDISSMKRGIVDAMRKFSPVGVESISIHPMFGPSTSEMKNQSIIITPITRGIWLPKIRRIFEENGAMVEILDEKEHDEVMAVIQGLIHFVYIAIGKTLRELDFDVEASRRFMSPMCEITMDLVGRILAQDHHLYATIQTNQKTEEVRNVFISECSHLSELVGKKETESFIEEMEKAKTHFKYTELALKRSDVLIHHTSTDSPM
jgi:prephenate dehydrogenase